MFVHSALRWERGESDCEQGGWGRPPRPRTPLAALLWGLRAEPAAAAVAGRLRGPIQNARVNK
jgi:hypothetical protein